MAQVRLQKFLAECGVGSRRKMEQFMREGRVQVNGLVVTELGRKIDPAVDKVEVNRRPVQAAPKGVMLLNKPRGVVSTLSDPEGRRTVSDFLTKHYASYFPVGRLDWDSTGLMILTNDGEMAERLMHPRFGFERVYEARVEGSVSEVILDKLRAGVRLSDGVVNADGEIIRSEANSTWVMVSIKEGRNRVVRRVFEKLGHPVMKLKRTVYGPFKLGRLQVGQVRVLTLKEYYQVRRKVMLSESGDASSEERAPRKFEPRDDTQSKNVRATGRGSRGRAGKGFDDKDLGEKGRSGKGQGGKDRGEKGFRGKGRGDKPRWERDSRKDSRDTGRFKSSRSEERRRPSKKGRPDRRRRRD